MRYGEMSEEKREPGCGFGGRISAFFDGETPASERREIEAHLAECAECAARLAAIRGISAALKSAYSPPVTEEFSDGLKVAYAMRRSDGILSLAERLTAAAAVVLAAAMIYIAADSQRLPVQGRYEPSIAAITAQMSDPASAEAPDEELLAKYILADLSTEGLE